MDFNSNKAIYLQIAEYVCEQVIVGNWTIEAKIPSVRDLAVQMEVNPNTVMRTYDLLQQKDIIFNKRGIGFFVALDAMNQIKTYRKTVFVEEELPHLFRNIYLLDISLDELKDRYELFISQNFKKSSDENK